MRIEEAKIFSFGKLQQRDFTFEPGINVVYGANEAGKTTLHEFLVAMLFGMEKSRGRAKETDGYLRYEPWHAPAYYSGALRFEVDGRHFYLERNFYYREKREVLRNEADGEELSVAYGDLAVLLGGIGRETFGNTYDIPQSGAATGRELSGVLAEYLADASESGNGGIHVARAQDLLEKKRKELNTELKREKEQRAQEQHALALEQELLEEDCRRLENALAKERRTLETATSEESVDVPIGHVAGKNADVLPGHVAGEAEESADVQSGTSAEGESADVQSGTSAAEEDTVRRNADPTQVCAGEPQENPPRRRGRSLLYAGIAAALVGMLGNWLFYRMAAYPAPVFGVTELLLGMTAVILCFMALRPKDRDTDGVLEEEETQAQQAEKETQAQLAEKETQAQLAEARRQNERLLARWEESLAEKETRLYNIRERLTAVSQPGARERGLWTELEAVSLAKDEIMKLAREFGEERKDEINSEVSRYVSALTGAKYDSVSVDEKGNLRVLTEGKEVPPEALSRGTLEQFYLAFRLAVGNIVTREEPMPLFLDETFAMYDDTRLMQTLRVLQGLDGQVILFTCQRREMELLEEMGIRYHRIEMEP